MLDLKKYQSQIDEVCRKRAVKRLSIFGSALTDKFNDKSDVDLIVEYDKPKVDDIVKAYFGLVDDLEKVFRRPVDLLTEKPFRNPYFKKEVDRTRRFIYEG